MRAMQRNFYRTGTHAVRIALAIGGIYWLKQALVLPGYVPWTIALMSFVIASRDGKEIRACLLAAAAFYFLAFAMDELGTETMWIGYGAGVEYFLTFAIAFTVMFHSMISFLIPIYAAFVKRINP
ncbi:hypothetical protein SANA_30280 [Gottschalkiaceae bacterium SANA]|nr:hypothetical protein SANA_30280 [Gottschalkiaceae bacterium SANA]